MQRRLLPLLLVLAVLFGAFLVRVPQLVGYFTGQQGFIMAVDEARELIRNRYVEPVDDEKLLTGAISGMAESLKDPYTSYIPPSKMTDFSKDLLGQFVGIGATVRKSGPHVLIATPLPASPALRAGLQPGDRVASIDGASLADLTIDQCIEKLKGVPGTDVRLSILRGGSEADAFASAEKLEITLQRAELSVSPVRGFRWLAASNKWDHLIDPAARIAYIRIEQFSGSASTDFAAALEDLRRLLDPSGNDPAWLRGIILDLRDNPGGLLDDAIKLCDMLMDSGVIVSTRSRVDAEASKKVGRRGESVSATSGQLAPKAELVVLVNGRSASASEVVSGALSEQTPPRATLIGTRSFGKGLVQATEPMTTGGILKLTEQFYFLPSGRLIQRKDDSVTWGVDPAPGFFVPMTDEQEVALLRARDVLEAVWPAAASRPPLPPEQEALISEARLSDPEWIRTKLQDLQLAAAVAALQGKVATGTLTLPPGGDASPLATTKRVQAAERAALERSRERLNRELDRVEQRLLTLDGAAPADATGTTPPAPDSPAAPK